MTAGSGRPSRWRRLRPTGIQFSFSGSVLALFTATTGYLMFRFPRFHGIKVSFAVLLLVNILLFLRFRPRGQRGWFDRIMDSNFFPRKLALTAEGKFLVIISLGMGFAAVNTGSNLLYLLLAMLLSIITASGILSELSLRQVSWTTDFPARAVAGEPTLFPIRLHNAKRSLSSFSLEGTLRPAGNVELPQSCPPLLKLPPGRHDTLYPALTFPRRGIYRLEAFSIGTRYPFSFFFKSRLVRCSHEIVVLPRGERPADRTVATLAAGLEQYAGKAGRGYDFLSVRPMEVGDDWRDVHWQQSARWNRFFVKEREALTALRATVSFDRRRYDLPLAAESGEEAVEWAASFVRSLARAGLDVGLWTRHGRLAPAPGSGAVVELLTSLARLDLEAEARALAAGGWEPPPWGGIHLVVDLDHPGPEEQPGQLQIRRPPGGGA